MDIKLLFTIALVIFLQMFAGVFLHLCTGKEGELCCQGFRFDSHLKRCIPCDKGLMGINCETECPFPTYGQDCQLICNCDVTNCNHVNGCIQSSKAADINICKGINGWSCCSGYKWDQKQSLCILCEEGYYGTNCDLFCPYPYFGLGCQSSCNCSKNDCDYVNGCTQLTEEQQNSTIASKINIITTEENGNEFRNNEKPNSTVMKDGTNRMETDLTTKDARHSQSKGIINAIIGLSIAALLITSIYIYSYLLEKRKRPTFTV